MTARVPGIPLKEKPVISLALPGAAFTVTR
jgi:hypothetical protein